MLRFCLLALGAVALQAQETRGQVLGRVVDPSGAVVVGAGVRAVNAATNVRTAATTNETGDYILPFLNAGEYTVSVEMAGFKTFIQEGITVRIDDRVTLNVKLEIGATTESVRIVAEAPLVDSSSASLGQVVDHRRVLELPLKDGNPMMLSNLAPGVLNFSVGGQTRPYDLNSDIAIDGTRRGQSQYTLDGAPNIQRGNVAYIPPPGVVEEFKIQTATFDASYGHTPGAIINVSLKAGANELHGQAYEFLQNPHLNANKFFANRAGLPKAVLHVNRWGSSASGPVYLPKLYSGRDRTFWTYGYEGIYSSDPRGTLTTTVPTDRQKGGDFSALLALGPSYQIYDPLTTTPAPNGRFSRSPLAGNIVPASRLDPTARKIADFWDAPNQAGTIDGRNNWTTSGPEWDHYYNHVFRVDHNPSERHRLFVRGSVNDRLQNYDRRFHDAVGNYFSRKNRGLALDDVYTFTPRLVLNTRYSYTRFIEGNRPMQMGFDIASLGFSTAYVNQINQVDPRAIKFPNISVDQYGALAGSAHSVRHDDLHDLAANLTGVVRAHTMRFGAGYRVYRENTFNFGQSSGSLSFSTSWTRGPLDSSPAAPIGQGMASFQMGLPTGGSFPINASYAEQSKVWSFYFQDDWKLTSKLTFSFGVRYELEQPLAERFNRSIRGFDATVASPIEAQAQAAYARAPIPEVPVSQFRVRGGLNFAGVGNLPRTLWESDKNDFMPRLGLAYALNTRTALRAGFGIFYDQLGVTRQHVDQTGFSRSTDLVASVDSGQHYIASLSNPFPSGFDRPAGAGLGLATNLGQGISFFNSRLLTPYMQRFQAGVQRELPAQSVLEIAYVGNRATKVRIGRDINATPRQYLSTSPVRDQATIDYLGAAVPNPFYPLLPRTSLSGQTVSRSQLLRPHPQFTGISYNNNQGYSWYHSMQARFEKRFSQNYTVSVSWTWSKLMEAIGYLNSTDPVPERVISDLDRTHRFTVSYVWELPFGRGKRWAPKAALIDRLVSGWQAQGIYQGQSGPALGFGNSIFTGRLADIPLPKDRRTIDRWFNIDAGFERNASRQLGSNIRTLKSRFSGVRADGLNQWDLSAIKNTNINERLRLQFRAEFINSWNHVQFDAPNTSPSSTAFGTVNADTQLPRTIQFGLKLLF
ncbi:MAG: carboxypeptidase-like regulatory domain-containing protein [Acidobacteriota bacterium]